MKRKWSKLTKVLLATIGTTLVVGGGFLALFLTNTPVLGLAPRIVSDIAIVGLAGTIATGVGTSIRAIVRASGRFGNKTKEFNAFHEMDKMQNSKQRSKTISQEKILKNAIKYANVRLRHIKLNSLPVTGRRYFFNGSDKQNIYKNHLEALTFALNVYQTAGKSGKVKYTERQIAKYQKLLEKAEGETTPFVLKYNWTRTVQEPTSNAVIYDHRTEIGCMKHSTLVAFQQIAKTAEINKNYGNAVRINYNVDSGYLRPYACLNDETKMEQVELLLLKEAYEMATTSTDGASLFPLNVERIDLKDSKSTTKKIDDIAELQEYISTLEKVVSPDIKTKFTKKRYLERDYTIESNNTTDEIFTEEINENIQ